MKPRDLALDVGIALVCFLLAFGVYAMADGALSIVTLAGMAASLAMRRLSPGSALALAWITALVEVGGGGQPELSNLAILAVLFSTSAQGSRVIKWAGFVSTFVGAAVVTVELLHGLDPQEYSFDSVRTGDASETREVILNALLVFFGCLVTFVLSWVLGLLSRAYSTTKASRIAQATAEKLRAVAERETATEQQRTRIARDMHDVVAHSLAVVIAQADGARYARKSADAVADGALLTIASTARSALGDVRLLLTQLRDDNLSGPQPGLGNLDALYEQLRGTGLRIRANSSGLPRRLPAGQQLAVFRIVQEALTNALRHGTDRSRLPWGWRGHRSR